MILNCWVIDDDPYIIRLVEKYVKRTKNLSFSGGETNPIEAMSKLKENKIAADIIFLDIGLPYISGLELLKELSKMAIIILISGEPNHAESAFENGAQGYLVKPLSYKKFLSSIERGRSIYRTKKSMNLAPPLPYYYIPGDGREVRIRVKTDDILYIESVNNYSSFNLPNGVFHLCYLTLKQIESLLPSPHFIRISRFIIVNMSKVAKYDAHDVALENGKVFSFGDPYRDEFIRQIKNTGMLY